MYPETMSSVKNWLHMCSSSEVVYKNYTTPGGCQKARFSYLMFPNLFIPNNRSQILMHDIRRAKSSKTLVLKLTHKAEMWPKVNKQLTSAVFRKVLWFITITQFTSGGCLQVPFRYLAFPNLCKDKYNISLKLTHKVNVTRGHQTIDFRCFQYRKECDNTIYFRKVSPGTMGTVSDVS